jgi:hypothetical protein
METISMKQNRTFEFNLVFASLANGFGKTRNLTTVSINNLYVFDNYFFFIIKFSLPWLFLYVSFS